ncbi:MAG TPA: ATP synthase F0 subunit B [Bdellovibrionales bacterium]|nr:ATP synthase F0 subunit B [Bdellovibrionales bacterium]
MMKVITSFAVAGTSAFATAAFAADAGHGAGVPQVVVYQAINFALFAIILFMLLKNKVVGHFTQRRNEYLAAALKYDHAKREAEHKIADLKSRMQKLEATASESVQKAKTEAAQLQGKIVADAQATSQKLQQETKRTLDAEVARAVQELREEVLAQATKAARELMQQQIKEQDQQRLQKEFVEKIRVVQQ